MPSYSQSCTRVPFIITSWSFQSLLSAVEIKKLKWVCASWVLQSMKMCLYAYICWGLSGLTFQKSPQRLYTEGDTHSCRRELTWIHQRFLISLQISFSALASFLLPSHKHTYYIYSGGSFIMSLTLRKKRQHKYEYFWKLNLTVWPQKALEDSGDVSVDAVKWIDLRVRSS